MSKLLDCISVQWPGIITYAYLRPLLCLSIATGFHSFHLLSSQGSGNLYSTLSELTADPFSIRHLPLILSRLSFRVLLFVLTMTPRFSLTSDEMEFGRTTTRTIPLSSNRSGETGRTYPIGQRVLPQNSTGDVECDKEKQRRRIAVAVGASKFAILLIRSELIF